MIFNVNTWPWRNEYIRQKVSHRFVSSILNFYFIDGCVKQDAANNTLEPKRKWIEKKKKTIPDLQNENRQYGVCRVCVSVRARISTKWKQNMQ